MGYIFIPIQDVTRVTNCPVFLVSYKLAQPLCPLTMPFGRVQAVVLRAEPRAPFAWVMLLTPGRPGG